MSRHLGSMVSYLRSKIIERWARIARDEELLSALAERNAAIRLAMDAQIAVSRLQEQVAQFHTAAVSNPIQPELSELSFEISRLREIVRSSSVNEGSGKHDPSWRQLDAIEVAYKRLLTEIASRREEVETIRMRLQKEARL